MKAASDEWQQKEDIKNNLMDSFIHIKYQPNIAIDTILLWGPFLNTTLVSAQNFDQQTCEVLHTMCLVGRGCVVWAFPGFHCFCMQQSSPQTTLLCTPTHTHHNTFFKKVLEVVPVFEVVPGDASAG